MPEPLNRHLDEVASRARTLATLPWLVRLAEVAGRWHDLGKYSEQFQGMLRGAVAADPDADDPEGDGHGRVDHSTFGAQYAVSLAKSAPEKRVARMLAYVIAGHHSGLADWRSGARSSLPARLEVQKPEIRSARARLPGELNNEQLPPGAEFERLSPPWTIEQAPFVMAMRCRVLFSLLVDADRLATEAFCDPARHRLRTPAPPLSELASRLRTHIDALRPKPGAEAVNAVRAGVLRACRDAAERVPGFFSLTVPTGGGKTLSSMSFALEHAARHGLRRVIYAAPFTSIIEQNADVFRRALGVADGSDLVLEHHSAVDQSRETERTRLMTENWDAPVIVTTNVQLLESMLASSTSACRKIHRVARSVILLDEAQALPATLLRPCLEVLRCLVNDMGCTVVLCTATQPALNVRKDFDIGLDGVGEMMGNSVSATFEALRRVSLERTGMLDDAELVARILEEPRCLCIVNSRAHAATLFEMVRERDPEAVHLSASMCAEHRSDVLAQVRERLASAPDRSCRVISTQVVEAGVDVDFPVVFRAMAGLDSIAQAAGRCNREGRLSGLGRTVVFETPWNTDGKVPHSIKTGAERATEVLESNEGDPLGPPAVETYFKLAYGVERGRPKDAAWDAPGVMKCFALARPSGELEADFRDAASRFKLIDEYQVPMLVPYGRTPLELEEAVRSCVERRDHRAFRQFQRLSVNVPERVRNAMLDGGAARRIEPFDVVVNGDAYDDQLGLRSDVLGPDINTLIS
jgi:CRISPR-associated endonuclease/helicase Cas3